MSSADLLIWRHAEAEDLEECDDMGGADLSRRLTTKGERQAQRVATWLRRHLPEQVRVLSSPAVRCEQTVLPLGQHYQIVPTLGPQATVDEVLQTIGWPDMAQTTLLVGHQPWLGGLLARLLELQTDHCSVRKASVWWLRRRERMGQLQTVLYTVQTPELL